MDGHDIISHSFATVVFKRLQGKLVEVYQGDCKETHLFSDHQLAQKSVIRGVIEDAEGDCLILRCDSYNKSNLVYLNCWGIHSIVPINGTITTKDIFINESTNKK